MSTVCIVGNVSKVVLNEKKNDVSKFNEGFIENILKIAKKARKDIFFK